MSFISRLRAAFKRDQLESNLDEELQFHVEMKTRANVEAGMPPEEARAAALRQFGNVAQVEEDARESWGLRWFEQFTRDLCFAFRTLRMNAGFTAVAGLSLALGIGANAAVFSLVNAILLRPLPFPNSKSLVRVTGYYPTGAWLALQNLSRTMNFATYADKPENGSEFNLTGQGEAIHVSGSVVSANIFSLLGSDAELGRTFRTGEDRSGADRLVILSHALWRSKFQSDPNVIGRVITLNGIDRRVVGVMPRDFNFLDSPAQLWIPLHIDPANPGENWAHGFKPVVARLKDGATIPQARNEIRQMVAEILPMFPYTMAKSWNADATVLPLQQDLVGNVRPQLMILLGAVGIVLLIACVNVASLLVALGATRRREIALRSALGAARERIVRQLLTESVVLALIGGAGGLAVGFAALSALKALLPADTPRLAAVGMDWRVLIFVSAVSILSGLAFGLAPALRISKSDLAIAMKAGGQRTTDAAGASLRSSLIVSEIALAVVLITSAGLLIRTLWQLVQVNPGFHGEQILTVHVTPDDSDCATRAACVALYNKLLAETRGLHGISDAAAANTVPLSREAPYVVAEIEGHPLEAGKNLAPLLWAGAVTPNYFQMMGIPILTGRAFTDSDGEHSARVVVVSAATARQYWPGENPIGKHIRLVWDDDWRTVVGVAGDVRQFNLADKPLDWIQGAIYMPYAQSVDASQKLPRAMYIIAHTSAGSGDFARSIHDLVAAVNPNVPVGEVRALRGIVAASTESSRSLMWLFVSFAAAALLLAVIGIYGVVSYSAAQRTYEMGIRIALGATPRNILAMVLGQGLRLVLAGLAIGMVAALALTRMLANFLYGVSPADPPTFILVAALLTFVTLLASYIPARRAASVNPVRALRFE